MMNCDNCAKMTKFDGRGVVFNCLPDFVRTRSVPCLLVDVSVTRRRYLLRLDVERIGRVCDGLMSKTK